eukprot:scaffold202423_cov30-Tisochrysis_lutea.AAC.4
MKFFAAPLHHACTAHQRTFATALSSNGMILLSKVHRCPTLEPSRSCRQLFLQSPPRTCWGIGLGPRPLTSAHSHAGSRGELDAHRR